jgi:hypothetical protein
MTEPTSQEEHCRVSDSEAVGAVASSISDSRPGKPLPPKEVRGIIFDHLAQIPRVIYLHVTDYSTGGSPPNHFAGGRSPYFPTVPATAPPIQLSIESFSRKLALQKYVPLLDYAMNLESTQHHNKRIFINPEVDIVVLLWKLYQLEHTLRPYFPGMFENHVMHIQIMDKICNVEIRLDRDKVRNIACVVYGMNVESKIDIPNATWKVLDIQLSFHDNIISSSDRLKKTKLGI